MKYLFAALLFSTSAIAGGAHTKAYINDESALLENSSESPYDLFNESQTLEIKFTKDEDNLEASAASAPGHIDQKFRDLHLYFDDLRSQVGVDGGCNSKFHVSYQLTFRDMKLYQGDHYIGPDNVNPPPNDKYEFDGGTLIVNEVEYDQHSVWLYAVDIRFNDGERHSFGYAFADVVCPLPVELQSFDVE